MDDDIRVEGIEGVSKDIQSYTDIIARQIMLINQLLSSNAPPKLLENSINVLEANLSPYMDNPYYDELKKLQVYYDDKLRYTHSKTRSQGLGDFFTEFYTKKYGLLLRHAKLKGFLPKTIKTEF